MAEVLGNIVLIGDVGVGKSSIINMIAGTKVAQVSDLYGAVGTTLESAAYILPVHGRNYRFFDTTGIDGGDTVKRAVSIANLYKLITRLDGGISLLMFCIRGPRIKRLTHEKWKLFHDIICKKEIPTLLVVTGLEKEEIMNEWWWDNRRRFEDRDICPDDTACITAIRGIRLTDGCHAFDEQYEESQLKIPNMILNRVLLHTRHVDKFNCQYSPNYVGGLLRQDLVREIVAQCNLPQGEARRLVEAFDTL